VAFSLPFNPHVAEDDKTKSGCPLPEHLVMRYQHLNLEEASKIQTLAEILQPLPNFQEAPFITLQCLLSSFSVILAASVALVSKELPRTKCTNAPQFVRVTSQ
jgi:hypothetical protein